MDKIKVIFLDIDGVLNTFYSSNETQMDEILLSYLKRIIDETGAKVVLTSSLRKNWNTKDYSLIPNASELRNNQDKLFKKYGIEIYGITPLYCENTEEGIYTWLWMHPETESFVTIDDESITCPDFIGTRLIKTSYLPYGVMIRDSRESSGLKEYQVEEAINILRRNIMETQKNKSKLDKSFIETVDSFQYERYLNCGESLGLSNEFYPNSTADVVAFAKIHMLLELGTIDENEFYSLSDLYIQYLSAKKRFDELLLTETEDLTLEQVNMCSSLNNEIIELEEELNKYKILDCGVNSYGFIDAISLTKV